MLVGFFFLSLKETEMNLNLEKKKKVGKKCDLELVLTVYCFYF